MDRLPVELFLAIVERCLPIPNSHAIAIPPTSPPPATLRLVRLEELATLSKSWRNTIHNSPTLWTTIQSSDPMECVEAALARSGGSLLKIYIGSFHFHADSFTSFTEIYHVRFLRFLRCVSAHVLRWGLIAWTVPFIDLFDEFPASPAPQLTHMKLVADTRFGAPRFRWERDTRAPDIFGGVVPNLRHLRLSTTSLDWGTEAYQSIRSLDIHCETYANCLTGDKIVEMLKATSHTLERLSLSIYNGGFDGSDTGHTAEIEESNALVALTRPSEPRIVLSNARSIRLDLYALEDLICYFEAPSFTDFELKSWPYYPSDTSDPEYESWILPRYQRLYPSHARHISQFVNRIAPEDLACRYITSGGYHARWGQGSLSLSLRDSDTSFRVRDIMQGHFQWVTQFLPPGYMEQTGVELVLQGSWTKDNVAIFVTEANRNGMMDKVKSLVVEIGDAALPVLDALSDPTIAPPLDNAWDSQDMVIQPGQPSWLLPSLTQFTLKDRPVDLLSGVLKMVSGRYRASDSQDASLRLPAYITRLHLQIRDTDSKTELEELRLLVGSDSVS